MPRSKKGLHKENVVIEERIFQGDREIKKMKNLEIDFFAFLL